MQTDPQDLTKVQQFQEKLLKVVVVGDIGCGKTSFVKRYIHEIFSIHYKSTVGVDFGLKVLRLDENNVLRLQFWDIAGQERFGNMTRVYYKEAVMALVVADATRPETLAEGAKKWKEDLDAKTEWLESTVPKRVILLVNKIDMLAEEDQENLKTGVLGGENLDDFCQKHNFHSWFGISTKDKEGMKEACQTIVDLSNSLPYCKEDSNKPAKLKEREPWTDLFPVGPTPTAVEPRNTAHSIGLTPTGVESPISESDLIETILGKIKDHSEKAEKFREDFMGVKEMSDTLKKLEKEDGSKKNISSEKMAERIELIMGTNALRDFFPKAERMQNYLKTRIGAEKVLECFGKSELPSSEKSLEFLTMLEAEQFIMELKLFCCQTHQKLQKQNSKVTQGFGILLNSVVSLCMDEQIPRSLFVVFLLENIMNYGYQYWRSKSNSDSEKETKKDSSVGPVSKDVWMRKSDKNFIDLILEVIDQYITKKKSSTSTVMKLRLEYCRFYYGLQSEVASGVVQFNKKSLQVVKFIHDELVNDLTLVKNPNWISDSYRITKIVDFMLKSSGECFVVESQ
jgi:Ras-related protein Rab-32